MGQAEIKPGKSNGGARTFDAVVCAGIAGLYELYGMGGNWD